MRMTISGSRNQFAGQERMLALQLAVNKMLPPRLRSDADSARAEAALARLLARKRRWRRHLAKARVVAE